MDKTPRFNAEMNKILNDIKPQKISCLICNKHFEIDEKDIEFFNKFRVPTPLNCPDCRRQMRLAFVNYTTFFKRNCDVPGHSEKLISSIPGGTKFPVYDFDYYWFSDRDRFEGGFDFNFNETFFNQFESLFTNSPQPALTRDPAASNSDYSSYGSRMKNCYYIFGGDNIENVMFGIWPMNTKESADVLITVNDNMIYEGVYPENCHNCNFVYFSNNCLDCSFIHDCRNCNDCFGCVNLRNKKFCIWNKQYTKEGYFEKIKEFNLGDIKKIKEYKEKFNDLIKSFTVRATRNEHSNNFSGNYIINSQKAFDSNWVMWSDNLKYTDFVLKQRDSYDCSVSSFCENLYSTSAVARNCSNVKFSVYGRDLMDCEYTMNCKNCQYCFGCIGLENSKYCIFNKQYEEPEYWEIVDKIKLKMLQDKQYGEFFPLSLSPFPYNASLSNIMYPTSKEEILKLHGWWHEDEKLNIPESMEVKTRSEIDSDIKNVTDGVLNIAIKSESNSKLFRIVKDELDFYRRKNIAIPALTPYERIIDRFKFVNNFKVFKDQCFKCNNDILSSYATSEGYKPYCDDCYKKEIY